MRIGTVTATIVLLLVLIPLASAEVIVFDTYDTTMSYDDGILHITKQLRLKNVGENPIIPGEVHFKISQDGDDGAPIVTNFMVKDKFDKELPTRQITGDTETSLVFTIWDPLLPEFFYDLTMTYDLIFEPSGLLFHQVALPEEKTTIPVKNLNTQYELPKKYHITYAPNADISSENDVRVVAWTVKDTYEFEYSIVPLPKLSFRTVNLFWIVIISLFLLNLIMRIRKKMKHS